MDKSAKNILFNAYWGSGGWLSEFNRKIDPADFDYAKSKGIMFDDIDISKSDLLQRLSEVSKNISVKTVTDAFLCSLTNKRLDWRSGLASFVNAERILTHENIADHYFGYGNNIDLNVLNFERIKWGGVRHSQGIYNLLDLELLSNENIPSPTSEDVELFKKIVSRIGNAPPDETASKLRDGLKEIFPVSKSERHMLVEILACAEILLPSRFDRKEPGKHDWTFALHWRGEDRYNKENCRYFFGMYGID